MENCFSKCRKKYHIQSHLETQSFICNLILTVTQINARLSLQWSHWRDVCWAHVTEAHSEILANNDGDWACCYCSPALCYMGMRTAGNPAFVELLYFVLPRQCWCFRVHNSRAHTHTNTHTLTHIDIKCKRDSPLQRLQSVHKANGRRRQIRRGAWVLLQRERKHIGRTFNLPQLCQFEHPEEMTSHDFL